LNKRYLQVTTASRERSFAPRLNANKSANELIYFAGTGSVNILQRIDTPRYFPNPIISVKHVGAHGWHALACLLLNQGVAIFSKYFLNYF
jgi:hypothetical protein